MVSSSPEDLIEVQKAELQKDLEPKGTETIAKVTQASPKGFIKALQTRVARSPSVGEDELNSHTTWIAVADVSFADMLCSVDRTCHRDTQAAGPEPLGAGSSSVQPRLSPAGRVNVPQVEFPRLRGRMSDNGEAELPASMYKSHSLATVREEAPPRRLRAYAAVASKPAEAPARPVFNIAAASTTTSLREAYAAAARAAGTPEPPGLVRA